MILECKDIEKTTVLPDKTEEKWGPLHGDINNTRRHLYEMFMEGVELSDGSFLSEEDKALRKARKEANEN